MYRFFCVFIVFLCLAQVDAAYMVQDGQLVNTDYVATLPAEEHHRLACEAYQSGDFKEAAKQFYIVSLNFPKLTIGQESLFYLGVSYFRLEEYDFANTAFTSYLKSSVAPALFHETIQYKFAIAEAFRKGAKCRFWETTYCPKWASGKTLALTIYDEVIASMPYDEITAHSLFAKGCLLWDMRAYRESVETLQRIPKRFPKHELAPTSFFIITKVYLDQSKREFQNPDILALAELNVKKFKECFPGEERIEEAELHVLYIKEVYANGFFQTGQLYERKNKPDAAVLYYVKTKNTFPDTLAAKNAKERLQCLCPDLLVQGNDSCPAY